MPAVTGRCADEPHARIEIPESRTAARELNVASVNIPGENSRQESRESVSEVAEVASLAVESASRAAG